MIEYIIVFGEDSDGLTGDYNILLYKQNWISDQINNLLYQITHSINNEYITEWELL